MLWAPCFRQLWHCLLPAFHWYKTKHWETMETTSVDGQLFTAFFKVQQLNVVFKKMEMITQTIQVWPGFIIKPVTASSVYVTLGNKMDQMSRTPFETLEALAEAFQQSWLIQTFYNTWNLPIVRTATSLTWLFSHFTARIHVCTERYDCDPIIFTLMHKDDEIFNTLSCWDDYTYFFLFNRGPSSTLHGNTAQSFPRLPGRHPRNRCGPGHPGGGEHGGGGWRADAQSAGGAELRHPQRHGVRAGSYQDRQGELPHMVIEGPSGVLLSPLPTLWTAACSNLWRIHRCFYKTFQRASLDFCLCLCRARPTSFEALLFCSFHLCVISLFCLCLQGWPMNRQLRKGPQIFHRSSESRASLPRAGAAPSAGLPS